MRKPNKGIVKHDFKQLDTNLNEVLIAKSIDCPKGFLRQGSYKTDSSLYLFFTQKKNYLLIGEIYYDRISVVGLDGPSTWEKVYKNAIVIGFDKNGESEWSTSLTLDHISKTHTIGKNNNVSSIYSILSDDTLDNLNFVYFCVNSLYSYKFDPIEEQILEENKTT